MFYVDTKQSQNETVEEADVEVIVREKKMVDKYIIKSGMLRFSFLLECCHPGTVPDPQLVAAMLQLVSFLFLPDGAKSAFDCFCRY